MQTLTISRTGGRSNYTLSPTRNTGELQDKFAKCTGKARKMALRDTRTKGSFPQFKAGMSTADYVKMFEAWGHLAPVEWAQLNDAPCALYCGEDTCETLPDGFETWEDFDAAQSADAAPESTLAAANDDAAPTVPDPEPAAHEEDVAAPVCAPADDEPAETGAAWFERIIAENKAKRDDCEARAQKVAPLDSVPFKHSDGERFGIAGPCMSEPGRFRFSYFDSRGAIGHCTRDTLALAMWEALDLGYLYATEDTAPVDPLPTQSDSVPVPGESEPLADRIMATIGAREPGSILTAKGYAQALEVSEIDAARECEKLAVSGKLVRFDYSAQGFPPGFALPYLAPGGDPVPTDTQPETAPQDGPVPGDTKPARGRRERREPCRYALFNASGEMVTWSSGIRGRNKLRQRAEDYREHPDAPFVARKVTHAECEAFSAAKHAATSAATLSAADPIACERMKPADPAPDDDETIPAPLDGLDVAELNDLAEFERAGGEVKPTAPAYRDDAPRSAPDPCLRIPDTDPRIRIPAQLKPFYSIMQNVGRARHLVNFHDGVSTHKDGSPFSDVRIFRNARARDKFCHDLKTQGYAAR